MQDKLLPENQRQAFDEAHGDLSWQSGLSETTLKAALLAHSAKYKLTMRNVCSSVHNVTQLVESEKIRESLAKILEMLESERSKAAAASAQLPMRRNDAVTDENGFFSMVGASSEALSRTGPALQEYKSLTKADEDLLAKRRLCTPEQQNQIDRTIEGYV